MTTANTTPASQAPQPPETDAQELARLRRQRNLLLLALGAVLVIGAGLLIKLAPSLADPADTSLGTGALYVALVALFRRRQ
ncbi:hypothetical protein [Streptomyces sp. NBC_01276]|uniref:hypothetical protein n=1 Tax=Streptomyces sp. NBC_01276 TaxID=2903808 RepID=UPI00352EC30C